MSVTKYTHRLRRSQESCPLIEYFSELLVDPGVYESDGPCSCRHWPVEYRTERETDQAFLAFSRVHPRWSFGHNDIEDLEHMVIVAELSPTSRISVVWRFGRNFGEHEKEKHEE